MRSTLSETRIYRSVADDALQNSEVGDFRGRAQLLVGRQSRVLEIGAGYSPLFRKSEGYDVKIVDHLETGDLKSKYRDMGVDVSRIEQVDFVYRGETIPELVGDAKFDFVFASHLIEHTTDFAGFLNGCSRVIEDDGAIILLVPDKRYCFDYFQPLTDTAKVVSDAIRKPIVHSLESLYREEMQVNAQYDGKQILAWWQGPVTDLHLMHANPMSRYARLVQKSLEGGYVDAHEYYFTPASFELIIQELNFLGILPLRLSLLTRARGCEFMAVLTKAPIRALTLDAFLALRKNLAIHAIREQMEAYERLTLPP